MEGGSCAAIQEESWSCHSEAARTVADCPCDWNSKITTGLEIYRAARSIVSALRASVRRVYRASLSNSVGPCGPL